MHRNKRYLVARINIGLGHLFYPGIGNHAFKILAGVACRRLFSCLGTRKITLAVKWNQIGALVNMQLERSYQISFIWDI
ncbi:hypothetical protein T4E_11131 [Trichinella pseudospiralis]|uniref:Uncharacterized protein n=1 Tax=Trichinella pseudospiralis TaxID=6337 RepID=A0A0V0Y160_TRIPS|nr:hypothetical protein T4E_11131 [Trichinella pseudospiralis]